MTKETQVDLRAEQLHLGHATHPDQQPSRSQEMPQQTPACRYMAVVIHEANHCNQTSSAGNSEKSATRSDSDAP
ncbi:hypothetical protein D3C78_1828430 [compost metagenome]